MKNKIELFPDGLSKDGFTEIEINPCKTVKNPDYDKELTPYEEEELVEECEEGEEEFWSVYIRRLNGEVQCVADCDTKEDAEKLQKLLIYISTNKK